VHEDEKMTLLRKLLDMQHSLRTVVEAAEVQAALAKSTGDEGFAFAIYMLRESLMIYSKELSKYVGKYIGESD
jgi:hypothetical protein